MKARFQKMGGKYNQWYTSKVTERAALKISLASQIFTKRELN
jgi:hypothetical protein